MDSSTESWLENKIRELFDYINVSTENIQVLLVSYYESVVCVINSDLGCIILLLIISTKQFTVGRRTVRLGRHL